MELSGLLRILFQDKKKWETINEEEKEKLFFILNRLYSRMFPIQAESLNKKDMDKVLAMDVIFTFFRSTIKIPTWMYVDWSKLKTIKFNNLIKDYDYKDKLILSYYKDILDELQKTVPLKDSIEVKKIKKRK